MLFRKRYTPMELLDTYRKEKEATADALGNVPFKSFKDWRMQYENEWNDSHSESSFLEAGVAIEITDAELATV